jgi:hypothetical protein
MIYIWLNAVAILAATLAGLAAGEALLRLAGSASTLRPLPTLLTSLVAEAWFAAILAGALILAPPKGGVWTMTIGSAVVIWAGFVLPATAVVLRRRGQGAGAIALDAGYWLLVMIVQAVVLRLVGLVPPPA